MTKSSNLQKSMLISLFIFSNLFINAQTKLVSIDSISSYTISEIDELLIANGIFPTLINRKYPVTLYKIIYKTLNHDNSEIIASGLFVVPQNHEKQFPMISYQHGTVLKKDDVPSNQSYESIVGIVYATEGYVATLPDYIGMGESPGFHPYQHAKTEAMSVIDILRAAKDAATDSINIQLSEFLFLTGYSLGGHATMAAHMYLEQNFSDEFTVTASTPMAGAYDMSSITKEALLQEVEYSNPGYVPYLTYAYNGVYDLWTESSEYFVSPYDVSLDTLMTGEYSMSTVNQYLPAIPINMLTAEVIDSISNNEGFKLNWALRQNDVYDWTPQSKMRMYHCASDKTVSPMNMVKAYDQFIANGAQNVSTEDPSPASGHSACASYALLASLKWINQVRDEVTGIEPSTSFGTPAEIKLFPNPINQNSILNFNKKGVLSYKLDIYKINGQIVFSKSNLKANQDFRFAQLNLTKGTYILRIIADDQSNFVKKIIVQ